MSHLVRILALLSAVVQSPAFDDETAQYIASMKERLNDRTIDLDARETLATEAAATLDRSARAEIGLPGKLARWDVAVELLDEFNDKNENHPRLREFGLQSAVYRWAQARAWHDQRAMRPAEVPIPSQESAALDDSIARLRRIAGGGPGPLSDNIRFRLAWSLTDRAALDPAGAPVATIRRDEALSLLKEPPVEPSLLGYHALLQAEVLHDLGRLEEAATQVARASRSESPPPEAEILDVLIPILIERRAFAEADKAIDAMHVAPPIKNLEHIRVDLGRWKAAEPGPAGVPLRRGMEDDLLERIQSLRQAGSPEIRVALSELAASGLAFESEAPRDFWEALAEGFELRGDPVAAAAACGKAASQAEREGRRTEAAESRLRAAGFLFRAGRFAEADASLEPIITDDQAGPSGAKASLLQALARQRLQADRTEPATDRYEQALLRHLQKFPDDPTSTEARWLLGVHEAKKGRREKALELWKAIPLDSPRWIDARLAASEALRDALADRIAAEDRDGLEPEFDQARSFIEESSESARQRSESDRADLLIAQARLDLTPLVGRPAVARETAEQALQMNLTPSQRHRAKLTRLIAMAAAGRYLEAEREAQQYPKWAVPEDRAALIDAVRSLDLAAASAETDLPQRRFGLVARTLLTPLLEDASLPDSARNELTFRMARAQLFQGDAQGARTTLQEWSPSTATADDRDLRDLADTYARLDANELAVDVQRLRLKRLGSGSRAWFDARYGLALAYYRLGRKRDAAQLVEATTILHPELGGGRLREKFIRLRQRLGSPQ